ncbi:patatin-like phospholipase family protein [Ectobacillus polymachus]|uniref:patatin-like phospholipase family protein n=1 Tax=Ectobacillus polymachus TaxID=1508806 RepID=UPI003A8B104E
MPRYRILSFDGGGVRGVLSAVLLERLCKEFPELVSTSDLISGTSVGSFLALGLAINQSPFDLLQLFSKKNLTNVFQAGIRWPILRPKYSNARLKKILRAIFPDQVKLYEIQKHVLVTAFDLSGVTRSNWRPVWFHNYPSSNTNHVNVLDAALASAAAPIYFPSYMQLIDGGVFANSPTVASIAVSVDERYGNRNLDQLVMLSIGTGAEKLMITQDTSEWGFLQWAFNPPEKQNPGEPNFPLLSVMLNGTTEANVMYSQSLLGTRFHQINPPLPENVALDDIDAYDLLVETAMNTNINKTIEFLRKEWY